MTIKSKQMKWFARLCLVFISFIVGLAASENEVVLPIKESKSKGPLPRKFRILTHLSKDHDWFISGSGQFNKNTFKEMIKHISFSQLLVLDLRMESHGFINDQIVSWTNGIANSVNLGKTAEEIEQDEIERLNEAAKEGRLFIYQNEKLKTRDVYKVKTVQTERNLVESQGYQYARLPILDHGWPNDETVDQFISLIKDLPKETWIHIHCRAGQGRTTTVLAMCDIIKNANRLTLKEITTRQKIMGGVDLMCLPASSHPQFNRISMRRNFIEKFYEYCRLNPLLDIPWSIWHQTNPALNN